VLPKNKSARFVPKQAHANLHLIPLKPKKPAAAVTVGSELLQLIFSFVL
jgi:hypothetical protein